MGKPFPMWQVSGPSIPSNAAEGAFIRAASQALFEPNPPPKRLYLVGSLRNEKIPEIANRLRDELSFEVFDDWFAAGPEADDYWMKYEKGKGHNFAEALDGYSAGHVFNFDKEHLDAADVVVLVLPAGKSGHLELGYAAGAKKKTYIVYEEEPERYDVMYKFATKVVVGIDQLIEELSK